MKFEKEILREIQQRELGRVHEGLEDIKLNRITESNVSKEVLEVILYYVYNVKDLYWRKYSKSGILDKVYRDFSKMLKNIEFTQEEKVFIAYNMYRGEYFFSSEVDPIWSVLFRRKLIKEFGDGSLEEALYKLRSYKEIVSLLKMENWPDRKELEDYVSKRIDNEFLESMNCGGFALCLNTCFFPGGSSDCKNDQELVDRNVSFLLEHIPFIRLLGDTELSEDEYIVEYRASKTAGHHFIRIDRQGKVEDKNGRGRPRVIEDITDEEDVWDTLAGCPHAIFAVKIDHEIHSTKYSYGIRGGQLFEDKVLDCLDDSVFEFEYHNHNYTISDDVDGTRYVYSNGELMATIISDETGTVVVEEDEKREYISNTNSSTFDRYLEDLICHDSNEEKEEPGDESDDKFEIEL